MSARILLVDDDPRSLSAYQRMLADVFPADTVTSGEAAMDALEHAGPYAVVVADMHMPERSGLELLVDVRRRFPDVVRVMLTGAQDQATAADAVNTGRVFCFLAKPCVGDRFVAAIQEAVEQHRKIRREREVLEQTFNGAVQLLTELLARLEPESFALGQRLRDRASSLGAAMQLPWTWELEVAAMLLRVGTMTIPPAVLARHRTGESLAGSEADLVQRIPEIGARMLAHIPRLAPVAEILRYQNKAYDGSGPPDDGIRGDELPVGARVLRALLDFQGLEDEGLPAFAAVARMRQNAQLYDPVVLDHLGKLLVDQAGPDSSQVRDVTVGEVKPGMVLAADVLSDEGIPLIKAGTRMTPTMLERLRNFAELGQVREPVRVLENPAPAATSLGNA